MVIGGLSRCGDTVDHPRRGGTLTKQSYSDVPRDGEDVHLTLRARVPPGTGLSQARRWFSDEKADNGSDTHVRGAQERRVTTDVTPRIPSSDLARSASQLRVCELLLESANRGRWTCTPRNRKSGIGCLCGCRSSWPCTGRRSPGRRSRPSCGQMADRAWLQSPMRTPTPKRSVH